MRPTSPGSGAHGAQPGRFATTRWSQVLAAGDAGAEELEEALAGLCAAYWYPTVLRPEGRLL